MISEWYTAVGFISIFTDINECDPSSGFVHGCQMKCNNFLGGYNCSCNRGFNLTSNGKNCSGNKRKDPSLCQQSVVATVLCKNFRSPVLALLKKLVISVSKFY